MGDLRWERFPSVAHSPCARSWLTIQFNLGLASNTVDAYARALEQFFSFCSSLSIAPEQATKDQIALFVRHLTTRPQARAEQSRENDSLSGLANATILQRLTAIRLFFDYLMEEGLRETNPVARGRYTPGKCFAGVRSQQLVERFTKLPWIPNDEQWRAVLEAARQEPLRNRVMFALAYDAGLRREELCSLETGDIDPAYRLLTIRAETTKNRRSRVVPYSEATGLLLAAYLHHRRQLSQDRGPLFLSESHRNQSRPITIWTWSKVVHGLAKRASVTQLTTHTLRHLCLTDLARAGWDIHEIATFAGHKSTQTTLLYIHLSGRELAKKLEQGMDGIHAWRVRLTGEVLHE